MAFVTKAEILQWISIQRPKMVVSDIPDHIMNKGHARVRAGLVRLKIHPLPTKNDDNDFLKMAASCIILSLCARARILTQTGGEIGEDRFRDVQYRFHNQSPMFFFATGTSKPFMDLLPTETLRMHFYGFLRAYAEYKFYEDHERYSAQPKVARDSTSRGARWNESHDVYDSADAVYGDTLEEW